MGRSTLSEPWARLLFPERLPYGDMALPGGELGIRDPAPRITDREVVEEVAVITRT